MSVEVDISLARMQPEGIPQHLDLCVECAKPIRVALQRALSFLAMGDPHIRILVLQ